MARIKRVPAQSRSRASWSLCSSVTFAVKFLLFPRRSQCPRARKSILLQSRLRNRATCPWKAGPCDGRQFAGGNRIAQFAQLAEVGTRTLGSSVNGGTVISPRNTSASSRGAASSNSSSSGESGAAPLLAASPPTLISMSTSSFLPSLRAAASSFSASFSESTESTARNSSAVFGGLVGLQVADHVPFGVVQIREARRFWPQNPERDFRRTGAVPRHKLRGCAPAAESC